MKISNSSQQLKYMQVLVWIALFGISTPKLTRTPVAINAFTITHNQNISTRSRTPKGVHTLAFTALGKEIEDDDDDDDSIPTLYNRDSHEEDCYIYCSDDDVDDTLQRLVSPAPESFHVIDSCVGRWNNEQKKKEKKEKDACDLEHVAKDLKALCRYILKPGSSLELYYTYRDETENGNGFNSEIKMLMWRVRANQNGSESKSGEKRGFSCDDLIQSLSSSSSSSSSASSSFSLEMYHEYNVLELSRRALELATGTGKNIDKGGGNPVKELCIDNEIDRIVKQAEIRLALTMGSDLRGRTSADACFNFALAGVPYKSKYYTNTSTNHPHRLFRTLVHVAIHELTRVGTRASFKPKYILQMIEKFAACDIMKGLDGANYELYKLAADCLEKKGHEDIQLIESLRTNNNKNNNDNGSSLGSFGFHSDRPLLWLWRFSARQRKIPLSDYNKYYMSSSSQDTTTAMSVIKWDDIFLDSSKPLVIDIGSGMGVSLLNLSTLVRNDNDQDEDVMYESSSSSSSSAAAAAASDTTTGELDINWSDCNYAGADLNPSMVRFANGIISRDSDRMGRIQFFHLTAVDFLKELRSYHGDVDMIMIHFPSPYRLLTSSTSSISSEPSSSSDDDDDDIGNSQLPSISSDGFMVTEELIGLASELLSTRKNHKGGTRTSSSSGHLFFQTKCEDVAVHIKNLCLPEAASNTSTCTFECVPSPDPVLDVDLRYEQEGKGGMRPQRVEKWIKAIPEAERAEGSCWWSSSCLPLLGRAETEVQCEFESTVVHRCLMRQRKDAKRESVV